MTLILAATGAFEDDVATEPVGDLEYGLNRIDAVDIDGSRLFDKLGSPLVKVCEDDDKDNEDAKNELLELQNFGGDAEQPASSKQPKKPLLQSSSSLPASKHKVPKFIKEKEVPTAVKDDRNCRSIEKAARGVKKKEEVQPSTGSRSNLCSCPVCSMENQPTALTCIACSNVLKPELAPDSWRCKSSLCQCSDYWNAGDVRLCGVCGTRKSTEVSD